MAPLEATVGLESLREREGYRQRVRVFFLRTLEGEAREKALARLVELQGRRGATGRGVSGISHPHGMFARTTN